MKIKLLITDVKVGLDSIGHEYLDSFIVIKDGRPCAVDPFTGAFLDEPEDMTQDELVEWGKKQIGKHLFVADLKARGYMAIGKTYIV